MGSRGCMSKQVTPRHCRQSFNGGSARAGSRESRQPSLPRESNDSADSDEWEKAGRALWAEGAVRPAEGKRDSGVGCWGGPERGGDERPATRGDLGAMLRNWSFPPGALGDTEGPQPKTGQARYASRVVPWAAGWGVHQKGARGGRERASAGGEMLARRTVQATRATRDGRKRSFIRSRQEIRCDSSVCCPGPRGAGGGVS